MRSESVNFSKDEVKRINEEAKTAANNIKECFKVIDHYVRTLIPNEAT